MKTVTLSEKELVVDYLLNMDSVCFMQLINKYKDTVEDAYYRFPEKQLNKIMGVSA